METTRLLTFISTFAPGDTGAIHAFVFDPASARIQPLSSTGDVENPFFLAISPDAKFLYSIHAPERFGGKPEEQIAAYAIRDSDGELALLNRQSSKGSASCFLGIDATGKTVLVANYRTGNVTSYPIREDGSLAEAASFFQHGNSDAESTTKPVPRAHCFITSPDNQFALAADLGLDQIIVYRLSAKDAKLTKHSVFQTNPGAGPRHLAFHPDGSRLYAINELANSISAYDWDTSAGTLVERQTISTLPREFTGSSACADLKITSDGKFLYGTNRGHDSIAIFKIQEDDCLKLLAIEPSHGKGPQNLAISPGGEFLLCANMPGNTVAVFRIDPAGGGLTLIGEPLAIPSPSCIKFIQYKG